jgi:hypothetical protein
MASRMETNVGGKFGTAVLVVLGQSREVACAPSYTAARGEIILSSGTVERDTSTRLYR